MVSLPHSRIERSKTRCLVVIGELCIVKANEDTFFPYSSYQSCNCITNEALTFIQRVCLKSRPNYSDTHLELEKLDSF